MEQERPTIIQRLRSWNRLDAACIHVIAQADDACASLAPRRTRSVPGWLKNVDLFLDFHIELVDVITGPTKVRVSDDEKHYESVNAFHHDW
jgi:hypothetical protein